MKDATMNDQIKITSTEPEIQSAEHVPHGPVRIAPADLALRVAMLEERVKALMLEIDILKARVLPKT